MKPFYERLGANMRLRRTRSGFSQQRIADTMGVDIATVSRWEAGKREIGVLTLIRYAKACGCLPADLLPWRMRDGE
jgi:transcriptional regulator with XRE-family HTH domain